MLGSPIVTKFHVPLARGHLTSRPRLESHLAESLTDGCRLVLVTAPAGFGKSTLISAWLRSINIPFTWLSLDSSDNEPRQFFSYLLGALQKIEPTLGTSLVNRIQIADSADPEMVYTDVMTCLVNEIALLPQKFILVLDDCHLLKTQLLLSQINFLIEKLPSQMLLVLLTREDLPLPISRMRVRRQVVEIRQAELQFNTDEIGDFLRNGMGITQLSQGNIIALEQRTEGWIAGLQLAALSIKYDPDPARFINSFTGSDRYILDYLLDEVFSHQPEEIQNFLLSTSILDRFCAPLCDAVLKVMEDLPIRFSENTQEFLEYVERANLFLIPLDYHREWYRYHHLFADLLNHALSRSFASKIPHLHLRASQWLESNGYIQEAVKHAFQTQDWLYAADIVERHAWDIIMHSQVGTVSEWCRTFPEHIMRNRPALCIFHSWALIIGFRKDDIPAANIRLEQAEAALSKIDPETRSNLIKGVTPVRLHTWVTGQITLLRSFILMMAPRKDANPQALIDLGQLSFDQLPLEDIPARSASLLDICYASQARSDAEDAEKKFGHVVSLALSGGNYFGAVVADYHRARGFFNQGKLHETIAFCRQKKKAYEALFVNPVKDLPAIALLDLALGCTLLEQNELAEAENLLVEGLKVGQWMPREELPGYLALARLYLAKGDKQGHSDALRRLDMRWPDIKYCTQALRVLANLMSCPDDPETRQAAAIWAASNIPDVGPGVIVPGIGPAWNDEGDYVVYLTWAQIQIILGKPQEALIVLQRILAVCRKNHLNHRVIELLLLEAQAYYVQNEKELAFQDVKSALISAELEGYLRLTDQGSLLIKILTEAFNDGIAPVYLGRVFEANAPFLDLQNTQSISQKNLGPISLVQKPDPNSTDLIEPLSNRELEVLKLMAEGLTNPEIASRLYLSPNTMKSHTQNIYGKLDVHTRVQAVNKAHELHLI